MIWGHYRIPAGSAAGFLSGNGDVQTAWRGSLTNPGQGWEETGTRVPSTLPRLKEGIERFFITDINNPAASSVAQSNLFVMMDIFADRAGMAGGQSSSRGVLLSNHVPGGSNVLFMDGHVEFIRWVPNFGSKFPLRIRDPQFAGRADGNNWLNDLALGTSDGG
jgi:prepilin-type processing-associated H-X9-DG protein